ncbi:MAG: hypothetical protein R6V74_03045, partial [Lutibacter sp.]
VLLFLISGHAAARSAIFQAAAPDVLGIKGEPVVNGEYITLKGEVVYNQLEGGFYEVAGTSYLNSRFNEENHLN